MCLMLPTKLPSSKSSNPMHNPSQRTKRNVFLLPQNSKKSAPLSVLRAAFYCFSIFTSSPLKTQSFGFCSLPVSCTTKAQRTEQRQGRTSFVVPLFGNECSTNNIKKFSFLLYFCHLLSLSYAFLHNSMFSLAFFTCPPLPTKEKEG